MKKGLSLIIFLLRNFVLRYFCRDMPEQRVTFCTHVSLLNIVRQISDTIIELAMWIDKFRNRKTDNGKRRDASQKFGRRRRRRWRRGVTRCLRSAINDDRADCSFLRAVVLSWFHRDHTIKTQWSYISCRWQKYVTEIRGNKFLLTLSRRHYIVICVYVYIYR